ncbi:MAG TPA: hypothetical protein VFZ47_10630 [Chitinophagaceae bacterium]
MTERTEFIFNTEGLGKQTSPSRGESKYVRALAHFVSYIFHPLFIPVYVAAFLIYIHPFAFAGVPDRLRLLRFLAVFVSATLLPAFSVFLMWRLGFINSIFLRTQKERIIPYSVAMIFYFWIWYVYKNLNDSPLQIKEFLLGSFLAVCGAWLANIVNKVSMHGTAVGGLLGFMLIHGWTDPSIGGAYMSVALVITGMVCTARLMVSDHSAKEVYGGLVIGILTQAIAIYFA